MNPKIATRRVSLLLLLFTLCAVTALAQTTAFTYQGRLTDGGTAANGNYDLQLTLWDASSGGLQQPQPSPVIVTRTSVLVTGGIFTVQLDFGASAFPGADRFLEIGVRPAGGGAFTILSPRQQITSTPHAIRSLNASSADAVTVSGVPGGSGNYIQNATTQQASANFNISGNGIAAGTLSSNIVNATTQYNIGGNRLVSTAGANNLFVGLGSGQANTSGVRNSFFGASAGAANNSNFNSFFGNLAGAANTDGQQNSFFGASAGAANKEGGANSFFGGSAGFDNTQGSSNSFFGENAGINNTTGSSNTLIGVAAGNTTLNQVNFSTAIGYNANVFTDHTIVLGTSQENVVIPTSGSGGNIQFGTPNFETGMTMIKAGNSRADLRFDGSTLKLVAVAGNPVGIPPPTNGIAITTAGNVGIGTISPAHRLSVIGGPSWTSSFWNGSMEFSNASAIGWQVNSAGWHFGIGQTNGGLYFFQTSSDLGSTLSPVSYDMAITDGGNVGIGTISPDRKLSVNGGASKPGGGSWDVFSDERLKNIKGRFTPGLKAVMQLQPIRYEYKRDNALGINSSGEHIGFGAQAVQKIIPEAVIEDDKGYLLINNDPIMWTMLNAIKQQQEEISRQQSAIDLLTTANAGLSARLRVVEGRLRPKARLARSVVRGGARREQ